MKENTQKMNALITSKRNGRFINLYTVIYLKNGETVDCEIKLSPRDKKCIHKLLFKIEQNLGE